MGAGGRRRLGETRAARGIVRTDWETEAAEPFGPRTPSGKMKPDEDKFVYPARGMETGESGAVASELLRL